MLIFLKNHPPLSNFTGSLWEAKSGAEVPVLLADQGGYKNVYGIVPTRPLKASTTYLAKFSYATRGEAATTTINFSTER